MHIASVLAVASILRIPMTISGLLARLISKGSALYWSGRTESSHKIFRISDSHNMRANIPAQGTRWLLQADTCITRESSLLRRKSLNAPRHTAFVSLQKKHELCRSATSALQSLRPYPDTHETRCSHVSAHNDGLGQINGRDTLELKQKLPSPLGISSGVAGC